MAWYDTGTVSVTNGSTAVIGVGTNFIAGVQVGEGFYGPDGRIYEIQAVVSATALTLADTYLGATQTGQDYKIVPTQSLVATLASQVSTLISDFQGVVDEAGEGKFDDGTAASAGITFTQDQDTGFFRPAANQIGMTVAGVQRALLTSTGLNSTVIGATTPAAISGTTGTFSGDLTVDTNTLFVDASTNRVGVGTSAPDFTVDIEAPIGDNSDAILRLKSLGTGDSDAAVILDSGTQGQSEVKFRRDGVDTARLVQYDNSNDLVLWNIATANQVFAKLTDDGNFIVDGTSTGTSATNYLEIKSDGYAVVRVDGDSANSAGEPGGAAVQLSVDSPAAINGVVSFIQQDDDSGYGTTYTGTISGSMLIGTVQSSALFFGVNSTARLRLGNTELYPVTDNVFDLGTGNQRYDDIFATNGTIQTSDRNEKQDIEVLSAAETRVAQACKGLLRKFRWKDAVAEKGDDARIHFGIIAQDLQDAFAAEGLDAGRYAMFISCTWWEVQTGTHTTTYETQEEAPAGATERTRLGVRYPELLAFIIAAI